MKILINSGLVLPVFAKRDRLIELMRQGGHDVYIGGYQKEAAGECARRGVGFRYIPFARAGLNPVADIKTILRYYRLIKAEGFDVVHGYTVKPNIFGSIAAKLAGVKEIYPTVNGLGYAFTGNSFKNKCVRAVICVLYRVAFACSTAVFFQNHDDADEMVRRHLIKRAKCVVVAGSGIDLEAYPYSETKDTNVFFMATRLLVTKGLREYFKAARAVKQKHPEARFLLAGALDPNPDGISKSELDMYINDGTVEYLGVVNDMPDALKRSSVFVLPSYYREGVPHANLEAMSTGRAIITTSAPGCRETVKNAGADGIGLNGILVKPQNPEQLAESMIWMLEHPEEVKKMGIEGRYYAEERFDVKKVNTMMVGTMGL